tara:strand:+ start:1222 stop:2250 length:1029 start_codon:yes stop_codon:yes gene_type:complete
VKNKILEKYNRCTFCNSKKLIKCKEKDPMNNFYVQAIKSDLNISDNLIKSIKTYQCLKCKIKLNNPWFNKKISSKIFSSIYGQHNRSWENLLNFMTNKILPNHGSLYDLLNNKMKIRRYAEYNSPFMGLFLHFYFNETRQNSKFYRSLHNSLLNYLSLRQLAGSSPKKKIESEKKSGFLAKKINNLRKKSKQKQNIIKSLFIDNSSLGWGLNDNHKSVGSKTYAQELFDLQILQLDYYKKYSFDLFGIFHSLDHTFEPSKLLNFALKNSKFVVVYCHNQKNGVTKQHQFSITKDFLSFLNKNKIYNLNLTSITKKKFETSEIYFICSKSKRNIVSLKKKIYG